MMTVVFIVMEITSAVAHIHTSLYFENVHMGAIYPSHCDGPATLVVRALVSVVNNDINYERPF